MLSVNEILTSLAFLVGLVALGLFIWELVKPEETTEERKLFRPKWRDTGWSEDNTGLKRSVGIFLFHIVDPNCSSHKLNYNVRTVYWYLDRDGPVNLHSSYTETTEIAKINVQRFLKEVKSFDLQKTARYTL